MTQPSIPEPIGAVHYELPRGGFAREDPIVYNSPKHSVVRSSIVVYVDNITQANALMSRWDEIMKAASDKVDEIFSQLQQDVEVPSG